MTYTIGKKSRLYKGRSTGYPVFYTFKDAKKEAEEQTNPVGFDVYLMKDSYLFKLNSDGNRCKR